MNINNEPGSETNEKTIRFSLNDIKKTSSGENDEENKVENADIPTEFEDVFSGDDEADTMPNDNPYIIGIQEVFDKKSNRINRDFQEYIPEEDSPDENESDIHIIKNKRLRILAIVLGAAAFAAIVVLLALRL